MEWLIALLCLCAGAGAGFYFARSGDKDKARADSLKKELEHMTVELNDYRSNVNQHFSKTAKLVDVLAASSREIYNHLAEGSQLLCDTEIIKVQDKSAKVDALPAQVKNIASAKEKDIASEEVIMQTPDEGWYEILPEDDDKNNEKSVH